MDGPWTATQASTSSSSITPISSGGVVVEDVERQLAGLGGLEVHLHAVQLLAEPLAGDGVHHLAPDARRLRGPGHEDDPAARRLELPRGVPDADGEVVVVDGVAAVVGGEANLF